MTIFVTRVGCWFSVMAHNHDHTGSIPVLATILLNES